MLTLAEKFSVPHIRQEGARFHVHSWGLCVGRHGDRFSTTWCSEPFCRDNLASVRDCQANGLDPAKIIHSVQAKEWLASEEGRSALSQEGRNG